MALLDTIDRLVRVLVTDPIDTVLFERRPLPAKTRVIALLRAAPAFALWGLLAVLYALLLCGLLLRPVLRYAAWPLLAPWSYLFGYRYRPDLGFSFENLRPGSEMDIIRRTYK